MKNADRPINPAYISIADSDGHPFLTSPEGANQGRHTCGNLGLTKREHFAGLAMQGLIGDCANETPKFIAEVAVMLADRLLAELEKPTDEPADL